MKRIFALALIASLLLCGCGARQEYYAETTVPTTVAPTEATTEPTTEATTEPTTEPAPVYFNPLNGQIIDEPFTGRIFANTICNDNDNAIPHVGVNQADIVMEMYVNHSKVRCLALYSDIESVENIGATRSTRLMFNDIAQHYSAILAHAGGMDFIIHDATERGLAHYNVDSLYRQGDPLMKATAHRDEKRAAPNNLYVSGAAIKAYAESQGVPMTLERDYGLIFTEDGTPEGGQDAQNILISMRYKKSLKETTMVYDEAAHKYTFWQYGKEMRDYYTDEPEQYDNVVVMLADVTVDNVEYVFQVVDFVAGGTGYYACGGKMIPMKWTCADEDSAFQFWTEDGEPLPFQQGRTYISICSLDSTVTCGNPETAE